MKRWGIEGCQIWNAESELGRMEFNEIGKWGTKWANKEWEIDKKRTVIIIKQEKGKWFLLRCMYSFFYISV